MSAPKHSLALAKKQCWSEVTSSQPRKASKNWGSAIVFQKRRQTRRQRDNLLSNTGSFFAGLRVLKDLLSICMQLLAHLVLLPSEVSYSPCRMLWLSHANPSTIWVTARNHSCVRCSGSHYKYQKIFTAVSNPPFGKKKLIHPRALWSSDKSFPDASLNNTKDFGHQPAVALMLWAGTKSHTERFRWWEKSKWSICIHSMGKAPYGEVIPSLATYLM